MINDSSRKKELPENEEIIKLFTPEITRCVAVLAVINIVAFIITYYISDNPGAIRRMLALWPTSHERIFMQVWRLFTFQFMHLNPLHIISNLMVIVHGGIVLERRFGFWKFLVFYLFSAAISAFLYEMLILVFDPSLSGYPRCSGASGGVYAIMAAILALYPKIKLGIFRINSKLSIPFWIVFIVVVVKDNHEIRNLRDGGEFIHLIALAIGYTGAKLLGRLSPKPS